jgi:hypothetical protein
MIKTTIPPPMYIAGTPFDADSRILDERLVVSWALAGCRYLESS